MIDIPISWSSALLALAAYIAVPSQPEWPGTLPVAASMSERGHAIPAPPRTNEARDPNSDSARVEHQTVCVASRNWSAGELGQTILYRSHRVGNKLAVGYFVYWSTERPWGNNVLSYTVLPALATDAVYSHFMFVLPGVKDLLYGAGDVEGVKVEFEERADGSLDVVSGVADDGTHHPVRLSRNDLVDSKGRLVLLTDVWSHQLGAHGGGKFADNPKHELHCYGLPTVHPMTDGVARAFRLGDEQKPLRANPAWETGFSPSAKSLALK